jgi:hypothetical protein
MPNAELYAAVLGHAGVALDHRVLDFDGAAHRVDDAAELDESPVASALEHVAVLARDHRVDEVGAQSPEPPSVRSSSALAMRLKPTTSAARIAAILRVSVIQRNSDEPA